MDIGPGDKLECVRFQFHGGLTIEQGRVYTCHDTHKAPDWVAPCVYCGDAENGVSLEEVTMPLGLAIWCPCHFRRWKPPESKAVLDLIAKHTTKTLEPA